MAGKSDSSVGGGEVGVAGMFLPLLTFSCTLNGSSI